MGHFLDDFITAGAPGTSECNTNLALLVQLCALLNIPLAIEKREGPCTCLIFLGIELDTIKLELRLPAKKLARLQALLKKWIEYKSCKKGDLESLVGQLHDASTVIRSGRTFIRRLIDLLKSAYHRPSSGYIRLNVEARSDILWWHSFIQHWNGLSMMQQSRKVNPDVTLTSDASGSWGCGAFSNTDWFQYQWPPSTQDYHITTKELIPIVIAMAIWGPAWQNNPFCAAATTKPLSASLIQVLAETPRLWDSCAACTSLLQKFNLLISAVHLAGKNNSLADALSRNNLAFFLHHYPQANRTPTNIPAALVDLLMHSKPDWTSQRWSRMFNSIFSQHSQAIQCGHTLPATADIATSAPTADLSPIQHLKRPFASLLHTLDDSTSSIAPSRATYLGSDSSTSSKPILTHSVPTCLDFTTSSEESNLRKRKRASHNDSAFQ